MQSSQQIYRPAAGVSSDFERLLRKFADTGSVRYEQFSQAWREMKFSYIYAGRDPERELKEFIEECIAIAVKLFLPPYTFETRVGGLYILYSLYHTQPYSPKVKIRMTVEQWMEALLFHDLVKEQQHYDTSFIFMRLRLDGAFYFVATPSEMHPSVVETGAETPYVEVTEVPEILPPAFVEQMDAIHDQYWKVKCALTGPEGNEPNASLDVVQADFTQQMSSCMKEYEDSVMHRVNEQAGSKKRKNVANDASSEDETSGATAGRARKKASTDSDGDDDPTTCGSKRNAKAPRSRAAAIKAKAYGSSATTGLWRHSSAAGGGEPGDTEGDGKTLMASGAKDKKRQQCAVPGSKGKPAARHRRSIQSSEDDEDSPDAHSDSEYEPPAGNSGRAKPKRAGKVAKKNLPTSGKKGDTSAKRGRKKQSQGGARDPTEGRANVQVEGDQSPHLGMPQL